jgi:ABC-2 type transport system permease protein
MQSIWPRLVVLMAWIPALVLATALVFWGLLEKKSLPSWLAWFQNMLPELIGEEPRTYRTAVWTFAYYLFFQTQTFFCMILVMIIGPALVSQDLRFNAMVLYFSRPLRRIDYFIGKLGVIGVVLGAVAIVPPVLAYVLGVAFSLDLSVVPDTFRVLLASIGGGLVVVLSAGTLMLAISSMSRNSLTIGAIWFGFWTLTFWGSVVLFWLAREQWCFVFSYTGNLERVQAAMLDTESAWKPFEKLSQERNDRAPQAAEMQRSAQRARAARPGQGPPQRPGIAMEQQKPPRADEQKRDAPGRPPPEQPSRVRGATFPWYWSAGVLAGLFGLSVWILSQRVKSLDRLR